MNNVRIAERYDLDVIVNIMRRYSSESPIKFQQVKHNEYHVRTLLTHIIMGHGVVFLGIKDNVTVGLLIAIRQPNVWNPDILMLQELAWYVLPEYRNGTIGYRLVKEYEKYAQELLNTNKICGYTLSKMSTSPNLKYEKLGLEKIEETWIGQ